MSDPFRLAVKKAVADVIRQATFTYKGEVQTVQDVYRGRLLFGREVDGKNVLVINEVPIPLDTFRAPTGAPANYSPWNLIIQGWTLDDPENPTDPADHFLASVKSLLAKEDGKRSGRGSGPGTKILGMNGLVDSIHLGPGVCRPADEFSETAYFYLEVTLYVIEELVDPLKYLSPSA